MSGWINFNGSLLTQETTLITADSRAFRYGDGLFETMRACKGTIQLKALHFNRLAAGMAVLRLKLPANSTADILEREVQRTIEKNGISGDARVRLSVFRGEGGLYETAGKGGGYLIQAWALPSIGSLNENGLVIGVYDGARKSRDLLSNIKSNNFLVYAMAAIHTRDNRWNDGLVLNDLGRVCDATIANVFWIKNNNIFTPPLTEGGVAGVMRKHLLNVLPSQGFTVKEEPVSVADLEHADEIFLTNAISGIRWVKELNDSRFGNHMTSQLYTSTF